MAEQPRVGDIQVAPYSEYEPGEPGFVIEQFAYNSYRSDPPGWCLPAWDERGFGDLGGVFPTREAAESALRSA